MLECEHDQFVPTADWREAQTELEAEVANKQKVNVLQLPFFKYRYYVVLLTGNLYNICVRCSPMQLCYSSFKANNVGYFNLLTYMEAFVYVPLLPQ